MTVAEGIEDQGQLRALRAMGCDHGQGFHLARPMPAAEFETSIAEWDRYRPAV